jgi:hypothetical protein
MARYAASHDPTYTKVADAWRQTMDPSPTDIGMLTPAYKKIAWVTKQYPFIIIALLSGIGIFGLCMVFRSNIIALASFLQRGF